VVRHGAAAEAATIAGDARAQAAHQRAATYATRRAAEAQRAQRTAGGR
jgi:hypothetical protein